MPTFFVIISILFLSIAVIISLVFVFSEQSIAGVVSSIISISALYAVSRWLYVATCCDRTYQLVAEVPIETTQMPDGSNVQTVKTDPLHIVNLTEQFHTVFPPGSTCYIKKLDHYSHGIQFDESDEKTWYFTPNIHKVEKN